MAWVQIDDHSFGHPKLVALSDGAFRLWVEGLIYCQLLLTDGHIPMSALLKFRYWTKKRTDELLASAAPGTAPLWTQRGDGIEVHDYHQWNDSKDVVLKKREASRTRWKRFRKRVANAVSSGVANGVANGIDNGSSSAVANALATRIPNPSTSGFKEQNQKVPRAMRAAPLVARRQPWLVYEGRFVINDGLHAELVGNLGSATADRDLKAWYLELDAELATSGEPIEDSRSFVKERFRQFVRARKKSAYEDWPEMFNCPECGQAHDGKPGTPCPNRNRV